MHILTAAASLAGIGGLEVAQLAACRELFARGHQIDLLYTAGGDLEADWDAIVGQRIRVGGYAFSRRAPLASAQDLLRVRNLARGLSPDLVYLHHHRHAPSLALTGSSAICHLHLPPAPHRSRQETVGLRAMLGYVAVSRFTAEQWRERLGVSQDRFVVVPNGIDAGGYEPAAAGRRRTIRQSLRLPLAPFLLVYAGRVDPEKGIETALQATALLGRDGYHLAVAGEPNPGSFGGDASAALAYGEGLRARYVGLPVTWLGRLGDVSDVLAAADLVVVPSHFAEPFGLIVLEALASGTPVLASATGAIPEILAEQFPESLVPPHDAEALAARVRSVSDWRATKPELGLRGRRFVEERYTAERMGDALDRALADLLRRGRTAQRTSRPRRRRRDP